MKRLLIAFVFVGTSAYGSVIAVANPTALGTSDVILWSQLGSSVSQSFSAWSSDNEFLNGTLSNGRGTVVSACATCNFRSDNGIGANDALMLTGTASTQGAPLTLNVSPVYGVGTYIQAATAAGDTGTQFTARIQAFAGVTSVLTESVTSDLAGDAVFLGVSAATAEITRVIFSLTDASGNVISGNFVLDKLYLENSLVVPPPSDPVSVPEPGMALLVSSGLLALVLGLRKRSARSLA